MSFLRSLAEILLSWGPPGIFLLALVDSAGIPIPEGTDVLLLLVAAADARTGYLCAGLATLGSILGCLILFYIGRKGGEAYLEKKIQHGWGKKFRRWFDRYGWLTVFIPTLVPAPLPMKVFVLCAGALGMRPFHFLLIVIVARAGRYFPEAYLGAQLGEHSVAWLHQHAWRLTGVAAGLFLLLFLLVKFQERWRERSVPPVA